MRVRAASVKARQVDRSDAMVRAQAHASVVLLLGAAALVHSAYRMWSGHPRSMFWIVVLGIAAALSLLTALAPWMGPLRVSIQRAALGGIIALTGAGLVALVPGMPLTSMLGAQGAVSALVLAEAGTQPGAVRWFWGCSFASLAVAAAYWVLMTRAA